MLGPLEVSERSSVFMLVSSLELFCFITFIEGSWRSELNLQFLRYRVQSLIHLRFFFNTFYGIAFHLLACVHA